MFFFKNVSLSKNHEFSMLTKAPWFGMIICSNNSSELLLINYINNTSIIKFKLWLKIF